MGNENTLPLPGYRFALTKIRLTLLMFVCAAALVSSPASSHPHVFAEAKMTLVLTPGGTVAKIQHHWVFDDLFSSTVIVEFDKNEDLKLDAEELKEVQSTIVDSIGEYNYFQTISSNGAAIKMARPPSLTASMDGTTLVIAFDSAPVKILPLHGKVSFGIFDPTFYTAIDFVEDGDLEAPALPAGCASKVVRPSPEEAMEQNKKNLTDAFFATTDPANMGQLVATRLEVTCPP
jgi:ABC-type uncharacterized transport system substrate-binding protein